MFMGKSVLSVVRECLLQTSVKCGLRGQRGVLSMQKGDAFIGVGWRRARMHCWEQPHIQTWLCRWNLVFPPASTWNRLRLHICTDWGVGSFTMMWLPKWLWLVRSGLLVLRILSRQEKNWVWEGTGGVHENRIGVWLLFKLFCSPLDCLVWDIRFVISGSPLGLGITPSSVWRQPRVCPQVVLSTGPSQVGGRRRGCCATLRCHWPSLPSTSPEIVWCSCDHLSSCPNRLHGFKCLWVLKYVCCVYRDSGLPHVWEVQMCPHMWESWLAAKHLEMEGMPTYMRSWAWTLLGSVGWTNCACAIQLLLVHLKEMQDLREELTHVCPSPVHPKRD